MGGAPEPCFVPALGLFPRVGFSVLRVQVLGFRSRRRSPCRHTGCGFHPFTFTLDLHLLFPPTREHKKKTRKKEKEKCKIPGGCHHLLVVPHACFVACLLKARLSRGLASVWRSCVVEQVVGQPRPSLSCTGVPWVSCLDPPVCAQESRGKEPTRCVGLNRVMWSWSWSRETRLDATQNIYRKEASKG